MGDDLFIVPFVGASLLIYRGNREPLKVELSGVKALIDALAAAADDFAADAPPGPAILPPTL